MCRAIAAVVVLFAGRAAARPELLPYDPVAASGAAVTDSAGTARFTVLTPRLIRMELAASRGAFEDRATLAVVNRALPLPAFSHAESGGVLTVTTAAVVLSYAVGAGFSPATLSVAPAGGSAAAGFRGWTFGDAAPGNLLGTIRSLDVLDAPPLNCSLATALVKNESQHCEWGLVSRDGWAIYNDTASPALGPDDWWAQPAASVDAADLYGFFHGSTFAARSPTTRSSAAARRCSRALRAACGGRAGTI
jgi:alpha-glucosidase